MINKKFIGNHHTNAERLQLIFKIQNRKPLILHQNVEGSQDKAQIALLRNLIDQLKLVNNQHNEHGLMFDLEFFAFLRKPERIHVDRMKNYYRVGTSLENQ